LWKVLNERKINNSQYSIRAFARALHLVPSHLSEILSGKRSVTLKALHKIGAALLLSTEEVSSFQRIEKNQVISNYENIKDEFDLISEWYYFAIISLSEIKDFQSNTDWIADRLGINKTTAKYAVSKLLEKGLLFETKKGEWFSANKSITTTVDIPSMAIKKFHNTSLEQAKDSLFNCPVEERDFSSMTISINSKNLEKAKKRTQEFRRELSEILKKGSKDRVYKFNFQLFPISKEKK